MTMNTSYTVRAAMLLRALDIVLPVDLMVALDEQGYDLEALNEDTFQALHQEAWGLEENARALQEEIEDTEELVNALYARAIELFDD